MPKYYIYAVLTHLTRKSALSMYQTSLHFVSSTFCVCVCVKLSYPEIFLDIYKLGQLSCESSRLKIQRAAVYERAKCQKYVFLPFVTQAPSQCFVCILFVLTRVIALCFISFNEDVTEGAKTLNQESTFGKTGSSPC